jgi:hypothetical protein
MKITIARLRSNVKYNGPLETVLDSFFENYVKWMDANPQHEYDTYNVSFGKNSPRRTPKTIDWADVIVIPSDSEFRYHGELQMNPKDLAKSESHMDTIRPYFEGKTVIMWRSDRGDTEELYRSFLPGIKNFTTIDEIDPAFGANIHGMKYHFIQTFKNPIAEMIGTEKTADFGYWGRLGKWSVPEEKNVRERIIRKIYRSELSTVLIGGGYPSGVQRDAGWIKDWKILYPMLEKCRSTIAWNWRDSKATTSRYIEALSVGMIPFVFDQYDSANTYHIDSWQRIGAFEEFKEKALLLRNEDFFNKKLEEYRNNYSKVLLSLDKYFEEFSIKMNFALDKSS